MSNHSAGRGPWALRLPAGPVAARGEPRVRGGSEPHPAVSGRPPRGAHRPRRPHPLRHSPPRAPAPRGLDARDDASTGPFSGRRPGSRRARPTSVDRVLEPAVRQKVGTDPRALQRAAPRARGRPTPSCSAPTTKASPTGSRPRCAKPEVKVYGEEAAFRSRATTRSTTRRRRASSPTTSGAFLRLPVKDIAAGHARQPARRGRGARGGRRSRSPNPTSRTTPGSGCAAPGGSGARRGLPALSARGEARAGPRLQGREGAPTTSR